MEICNTARELHDLLIITLLSSLENVARLQVGKVESIICMEAPTSKPYSLVK